MPEHGRVDDDTPAVDQAPAPAPKPVRKQPVWTYFLTPLSVIVGACIIALAVYDTRGNDTQPPAAAAVETDAVSRAPTGAAATPKDLLTAFTGYAQQLGLDTAKFNQCLQQPASVATINAQLQRGNALGITGTPTFFINNKMIVGTQPVAVFDEVIAAELKGSPTSIDGYSAAIKQLAATSPPGFAIVATKPDVSDAQFEGATNARVVIAEFSDFQCPFCKRWVDQTIEHIRGEVGKDVSLAFLHFPITQIHPNAGNAALVSVCAAQQGKFWEMHDLLFQRQDEWANLK